MSLAILLAMCVGVQSIFAETPAEEKGLASFYAGKFQGRKTANGETFDTKKLTAAHKTLPFNTIVKVTNLENEKWVLVRINDRGPFVEERIIDLSRIAASTIGMVAHGIVPVAVEVVLPGDGKTYHHDPPDYSESNRFKIQIGAYIEVANAEAASNILKNHGLSPEFEKSENGVTRVVVNNVLPIDMQLTRTILDLAGFKTVLVRKQREL